MKWHVFSLDRVMRVRATQESVARQGFGAAVEHARRADQDSDSTYRRYQANLAAQAGLRGYGMNLLAFRDLDTLRACAVIEADRRRDDSHTKVGAAQDLWLEAKRKLAALERLDEKERVVHQHALLAEQEAEADDVVTTQSNRRSSRTLMAPREEGSP
jgi:flagellar export protein FliJ